MELRNIAHGSAEYDAMIQLRIRALLDPIGVPSSYIVPENEASHFHIGAFEGEIIVGCCVLTPRSSESLQLRQMCVDPNLRSKNIGAAILRFAENLAMEKGYRHIMMHARDVVIRFYEKSGYRIFGEPFTEVGIGHHKMEKTLG